MDQHNLSQSPVTPYRWVVLGIAWLSFFSLAMSWYVMPTLEPMVLNLYRITPQQYSTALTIPFLVAAVLAIGGGMLADRLGIRIAASLGVLIAGLGFVARAHVAGYISLLVPMMLVGVGLGLLLPNLPKLVSIWFPPHEAGLATGIYNTGLMGGTGTGLVLAPLLPGWTAGNLILGAWVLALAVVFFVIVRDAPAGRRLPRASALEGLRVAARSRSVRAAAVAVMVAVAGMVSFQGALPRGLHEVYGLSMAEGGRVASLVTYLGIAGALTLPALADRLRRRKLFLVTLPVAFSTIMFLTWLGGESTTVLVVGASVAGYLAGGSLPLLMEVPAFLPRVKEDPVEAQHVGGAAGLVGSLMNLGGFIGLPFIVLPVIASAGYTLGFLVAAGLFAAQALFALRIAVPDKG